MPQGLEDYIYKIAARSDYNSPFSPSLGGGIQENVYNIVPGNLCKFIIHITYSFLTRCLGNNRHFFQLAMLVLFSLEIDHILQKITL